MKDEQIAREIVDLNCVTDADDDVPDGVILFKDVVGNMVGKINLPEEPKKEDDVAP